MRYAIIIDMKKIITTPDPRLREKSEKIREITPEVRKTIEQMRKLSIDWENAHPYEMSAAMAAPQMGVNQRIIVVRDNFDEKAKPAFTALINPEVIRTKGKTIVDFEGCLSVPRIYGRVPRASKAYVRALTEDGKEVEIRANGELARTLLHEIDHLDGILFIDRIKGKKDAFFEMTGKGELAQLDYDTEVGPNKELFPDE